MDIQNKKRSTDMAKRKVGRPKAKWGKIGPPKSAKRKAFLKGIRPKKKKASKRKTKR